MQDRFYATLAFVKYSRKDNALLCALINEIDERMNNLHYNYPAFCLKYLLHSTTTPSRGQTDNRFRSKAMISQQTLPGNTLLSTK